MDDKLADIDSEIELVNSEKNGHEVVLRADFNEIYDTYFKDIIRKSEYCVAPSGVLISHSDASKAIPNVEIKAGNATNYIIDDNYMSNDTRENAFKFIEKRENRNLEFDSVTVSPSVSHSTALILIMLREKGIKKFYSVAPAYFSIIEQAKYLGFAISLIYGGQNEDYYCNIETVINSFPINEPFVFTLFNPRYPLGDSIDIDYLEELLSKLGNNAYVIIDEAQDYIFPSLLRNIEKKTAANIFRVFGFFKSIGLHGAKAAMILHNIAYRKRLTEISETIGGTLDKYSESLLNYFSQNQNKYLEAIYHVKKQVSTNADLLNLLRDERYIEARKVDNGFLSSIIINTGKINYTSFRRKMLETFRDFKSPVAIGSTQYFPYNGKNEMIRINYFQKKADFEKSILTINKCRKKLFLIHYCDDLSAKLVHSTIFFRDSTISITALIFPNAFVLFFA